MTSPILLRWARPMLLLVLAAAVLWAFLGHLRLAEEVDPDVHQPAGEIVEAWTRVWCPREHRASKDPRRAGEECQRRREQQDRNDLGHWGRGYHD